MEPSYGAGQAQGQVGAPPKQSAMQEHAAKLHDLATQMAQCNERLRGLTSRVFGPEPEATATDANKQPSPSGVLYVAAFGAERIGLEVDRLRNTISKLEQVA